MWINVTVLLEHKFNCRNGGDICLTLKRLCAILGKSHRFGVCVVMLICHRLGCNTNHLNIIDISFCLTFSYHKTITHLFTADSMIYMHNYYKPKKSHIESPYVSVCAFVLSYKNSTSVLTTFTTANLNEEE